ncbi:hypothetical protein FSP39_003501 [Pinctada imbricata]|uniref:Uncharacterized protein n=1 Tax=Pinctada imbricata TaxID=66713 RepID=A0AA88XYN0_PINIB|nr:hypothetical protein FSP39_003501 [Pinctada imbricata]
MCDRRTDGRRRQNQYFSHCGLGYPWKRWEKISLSYPYGREKNNQSPDVIRDTEIQPSCPGFAFVHDSASLVVVQANPVHSGWISLSLITTGDRFY